MCRHVQTTVLILISTSLAKTGWKEARKGKTFISEKTSFRWSILVLLVELSPFFAVLRIRIGFNADPDPAFYLNADPDPDSRS